MAVTKGKGKAKNARGQDKKHDKGYKDILSDRLVFLQFLEKYFAKSWTANISADDIEQVKSSFVTDKFKYLDSDLIYKLKINGADVYFYVLIELQSQVDFTMPFRLLNYIVALLNFIFNNTKKSVREGKGFRLPAVVPIVLYNGEDKWTPPMTFREYTKGSGIFGDNIIDFRYLLIDVSRMDDDATEPVENPLDAVFVVEKLRIRKRLTPDKLVDWWTEKASGLSDDHIDTLIKWVNYTYLNGEMSQETKEALKYDSKKGGGTMKSVFDELVENEVRKVMRKETKRKAMAIARNLRAKGMGVDDVADATGLTVDDVLKL